jgi:uroporphyrinogen-III synthase
MSSPTVALFRAREDALGSAQALGARGVAACLAPVLSFVATGAAPPEGPFDFAVATSAQALALATPALRAAARGLPLYAVGARAAAEAPVQDSAPDVATLLPRLPQGRALYLAGRDRKPELEAALAGRVAVVEVYAAEARAAWDEAEARAVAQAAAALHYSERSAVLALALAERAGIASAFRRLPHVCLSRAVAAPLAAAGATRILWPQRPEQEALFDTLESALADYGGA